MRQEAGYTPRWAPSKPDQSHSLDSKPLTLVEAPSGWEGADPGVLSHQLDDTALRAAISNSRPLDRGQPHEMRNLSPYVGGGTPILFL